MISSLFRPVVPSCQIQASGLILELQPTGTKLSWYAIIRLVKITFLNISALGSIITFCKSAETVTQSLILSF